jgi:uncharacterized membrane protein
MGIKVPWTLADEDNWNATHRFGGRVWIACGIISLARIPLGNISPVLGGGVTFAVMLAAILLPTAYSYLYYRKHHTDEE